jgi:hypothetical protein
MSSENTTEFFPKIGAVVEGQPTTQVDGEEEQLVQELESLCMNCHEQVRSMQRVLLSQNLTPHYQVGNDPLAAHINPVFPRGHSRIISMRALWN